MSFLFFSLMSKFGNLRLYTLLAILVIAVGGIIVRLFSLQIIRHTFYTALAKDQQEVLQKLIPRRGEIFIQERGNVWQPLAVNRTFQTVFLVPKEVTGKNVVAEKLAPLLDIPLDKIIDKLKYPDKLPVFKKFLEQQSINVTNTWLSKMYGERAEIHRIYDRGKNSGYRSNGQEFCRRYVRRDCLCL